jgi:nicotinamide mononucleotide transporter
MGAIINWLSDNWIEVCGAATGLVYLWFSIKQHFLTWPLGLATSLFYIYIFFVSKFYADMALQVYYVVISIYGWWAWLHGGQSGGGLTVSTTHRSLWLMSMLAFGVTFVVISWILIRFTDSVIPYWDAFTTALSIIATWMLARKKIEHWILWIIVDFVSLILYLWKGLYPTSLLFMVYTVMAFVGYFSWKNELNDKKWIPAVN